MNTQDLPLLAERVNAIRQSKGRPMLTKTDMMEWDRLLKPYPWALVDKAIDEYRKLSPHVPEPSDVIAAIRSVDGHPGPDEAWPIALKGASQWNSIITTAEIDEARLAAMDLLQDDEHRDEIAARKVFQDAYVRLVAEARRQGRPAKWVFEPGWDAAGREPVAREALERGVITEEQALQLAPNLQPTKALPEMEKVFQLVADKPADPEVVKKALAEAKAAIERSRP